jgi:hypothetical protein
MACSGEDSQSSLTKLIQGNHIPLGHIVISKEASKFKPVTKYNVVYIIAAVIINEANEVSLVL